MSKGMVPSNPLVQRLHGKCGLHTRGYAPGECVLCDAADEIERLERENEELRFVGAGDFEDNQRLRAENSAKDRHMADYHTMHDEIERLRAALEKAEDKLLRTGNLHCSECGAWLTTAMIGWHRCKEPAPSAETKAEPRLEAGYGEKLVR